MIDLGDYLEKRRQLVEAELQHAVPNSDGLPDGLQEAMRYSVLVGGKRLRPILCLAAAEAVGGSPDAAIQPAIAVEVLHTYTLIHDDLPSMDDDDERRGQPTSHIKFGEANAILAGDALQALAFHIVAGEIAPTGYPANQLVKELTAASMSVVGGQFADLTCAGSAVDAEMVDFVHRHKTADLFIAAIRMGAITGGATPEQLEALTRYATALGLAFQIVDDILDADGEENPDEHGLSCVPLFGADEARRRVAMLTDQAIAALDDFGPESEPLVKLAEHMKLRAH
jgi:geranylgeranyl diphosphate synthase type II